MATARPNKIIQAELLRLLRLSPTGRLLAEDVVDAARAPSSPLHGEFEWNDGVAAELYRLIQAREIIRVQVIVHPANPGVEIPQFVHVSVDTVGYRDQTQVVGIQSEYRVRQADAVRDIVQTAHRFSWMQEPQWQAFMREIDTAADRVRKALHLP